MTDSNPGRRVDDAEAHAHKRAGDDVPRLHHRLDDGGEMTIGRRLDETDEMMRHVLNTQMQIIHGLNDVRAAVEKLADETVGIREMEADVTGALRLMARVSRVVGVLWKPLLFIAVAGSSVYLWAKGVVAGIWR